MKSALSVLRRWVDLDRELVRGGVKLYAFAEKWGVDYSTAQRDIRAFRALGQVIGQDDIRAGPASSRRKDITDGPRGGFGYHGSAPLFYRNAVNAGSAG